MGIKKDIGKTYNEHLSNLKSSPDEKIWERIEESLNKKKERKIIPFWLTFGVLGIFLISGAGITYTYFSTTESDQIEPIIASPSNNNTPIKETIFNDTLIDSLPKEIVNNNDLKVIIEQDDLKTNTYSSSNNSELLLNGEKVDNATLTTKNPTTNNNSDKSTSQTSKENSNTTNNKFFKNSVIDSTETLIVEKAIKDSIATPKTLEKEELSPKKEETKKSNLVLSAFAIPTYYSSLTKGSSIDNSLEDNKKEGEITMSYRLMISYQTSEAFSLRIGAGITNLNYTTLAATTTDGNGLLNDMYNFNAISIDNNLISNINNNNLFGSSSTIDFKQKLTYIEIPLEAIYIFTDKKFQWKAIGGISLNILSSNDIIAISSNGNSSSIGQANNLSTISASLNIGGGVNYLLTNKLYVSTEPMFKYYFNTYNRGAKSLKPYSVGIAFGLSYSF